MHPKPSSSNCRNNDWMSPSGDGNLAPCFRTQSQQTVIARIGCLAMIAAVVTLSGCYIPGGGWTMRTGVDFRTHRKPGAYVEMVDTRWDEWNRLAVQNAMNADATALGQSPGMLPQATGVWSSTFGPMPSMQGAMQSMTPGSIDNGSSMTPMAPAATDSQSTSSMPPDDGMTPAPVDGDDSIEPQVPAMDSPAASGTDGLNRSRVSSGLRSRRPNLVPVSTGASAANVDDGDADATATPPATPDRELSAVDESAGIPLPPDVEEADLVEPGDADGATDQDLDLDATDFIRDRADAETTRTQVQRRRSPGNPGGSRSNTQQVSATADSRSPGSSRKTGTTSDAGSGNRRNRPTIRPAGANSSRSATAGDSDQGQTSGNRAATAARRATSSPSAAVPARAWMFRRR